jgi:hypothetical protein
MRRRYSLVRHAAPQSEYYQTALKLSSIGNITALLTCIVSSLQIRKHDQQTSIALVAGRV